MTITPIVYVDIRFNLGELSQHISLLELARTTLPVGEGYNKASKLIEELEAVHKRYSNLK